MTCFLRQKSEITGDLRDKSEVYLVRIKVYDEIQSKSGWKCDKNMKKSMKLRINVR